jgi:hypothetical protein
MSKNTVKKLVTKEEVENATNCVFSESGLKLVIKTRTELIRVLNEWSEYVNDVFAYCIRKRQSQKFTKEELAGLKDEITRYFETIILERINKEDSA